MQERCRKNKTRPRALTHSPRAACTNKSAVGTNSYAPMRYFSLGTFCAHVRPLIRTGNSILGISGRESAKRTRGEHRLLARARTYARIERENRSPLFCVSIPPGKLRRKTENTPPPARTFGARQPNFVH